MALQATQAERAFWLSACVTSYSTFLSEVRSAGRCLGWLGWSRWILEPVRIPSLAGR